MRFPEFNNSWNFCKLSETSKKLEYGIGASAVSFDGNHRYIRITDISNWGNNEITSPSFLDKTAILKDKDILLARTGATVGDSFIYKDDGIESYFAGFLIRAKIEKHNPYFIYYQLKTDRYHQWVKISSARSGQPGINSEQYGSYQLSITSSEEENKIASFLTTIDERICTQNKIIREYETIIKQINDEFFNSLKTYTFFKLIYDKASEGGTPDTKNISYYQNGTIPFIKIDDLNKKYLIQNKAFITESGLAKSSAWLIPTGAILLSNGATIGETTITTYPVATKQGILGIVPNEKFYIEFLYYLFKSKIFRKSLKKITTKGTMDAAYLKDIDKIKIPVCNLAKQKEFAKSISFFEEKLECEKRLLNRLNSLKFYLLNNLFI